MFAVYGGRDNQFPSQTVDDFESALGAAGARPQFVRYSSQGHAFITDVEATRVEGSDAADAWRAWCQFLDESLGGGGGGRGGSGKR